MRALRLLLAAVLFGTLLAATPPAGAEEAAASQCYEATIRITAHTTNGTAMARPGVWARWCQTNGAIQLGTLWRCSPNLDVGYMDQVAPCELTYKSATGYPFRTLKWDFDYQAYGLGKDLDLSVTFWQSGAYEATLTYPARG